MTFAHLKTVTSRTLVLPLANIDTDQIMPAKFLSMTTKAGLGEHVFANLRYDEAGELTDHELNSEDGKACEILVAGHNFVDNPGAEVTVDLESCEVRLPRNGGTYSFDVDAFSRHCLMEGVDEMGYLQNQDDAITNYECSRA